MQKIQDETDAAASFKEAAAAAGPSPASIAVVKEQTTDPMAAAAAGAAALRQSPSSSSLSSLAPPAAAAATANVGSSGRSGSGMIPLAVAQEAAARQQQWLDQLQRQLDAPDLAMQAALESERTLRREQDVEYQQVCVDGRSVLGFTLWTVPAGSRRGISGVGQGGHREDSLLQPACQWLRQHVLPQIIDFHVAI